MSSPISFKLYALSLELSACTAYWSLHHFAEFDQFLDFLAAGDRLQRLLLLYVFRLRAGVVTDAAHAVNDTRPLDALREAAHHINDALAFVFGYFYIDCHGGYLTT